MTSRLRRPAGALLATAVATSIFGIIPAAHAVDRTVTGIVTESGSGTALEGIEVYALHQVDGEWNYYEGEFGSGVTGVDGSYSLTLPEDQYLLQFTDYSDSSHLSEYHLDAETIEEATPITVAGANEIVDADLVEAGHIAGTVTAPGVFDPTGIWVQVYREIEYPSGGTRWVWFTGSRAEADGTYDVAGLAEGTYRVGFDDASELEEDVTYATEFYPDKASVRLAEGVVVVAGETTVGINAALALDSTVSGSVTDAAGAPVGDADISVSLRVGDEWDEVGYAETAPDGTYVVRGVPAGTFRVSFGAYIADDYVYEAWNNAEGLDEGDDIVAGINQDITATNAQLVSGEHDEPEVLYLEGVTIPMISGTPQVGQTLTVTAGTWTPADITATYEWYNDDGAIAGATASTYTPTAADQGKTLVVLVNASKPGYQDRMNMSNVVGPIAAAPVPAVVAPAPAPAPAPVPAPEPAPVISFSKKIDVVGSMTVGSTLKLKNFKALVSRAVVSYKIQWFAGSKKIKKATKPKLKVTKALKGKKIFVKVSATVDGTTKTVKVKVGKIR